MFTVGIWQLEQCAGLYLPNEKPVILEINDRMIFVIIQLLSHIDNLVCEKYSNFIWKLCCRRTCGKGRTPALCRHWPPSPPPPCRSPRQCSTDQLGRPGQSGHLGPGEAAGHGRAEEDVDTKHDKEEDPEDDTKPEEPTRTQLAVPGTR